MDKIRKAITNSDWQGFQVRISVVNCHTDVLWQVFNTDGRGQVSLAELHKTLKQARPRGSRKDSVSSSDLTGLVKDNQMIKEVMMENLC